MGLPVTVASSDVKPSERCVPIVLGRVLSLRRIDTGGVDGAVDLFRKRDRRRLHRAVVDEHLDVDVSGAAGVPARVDGREARGTAGIHRLNAAQPVTVEVVWRIT